MLAFTTGNLLEADVDALVNTVNTVGVMGKGVALMFKEQFPENYRAYRAACEQKAVQVGRMFVTERSDLVGPKWIVNFPTKEDWRGRSKIEWIDEGLEDLKRVITEQKMRSIALPPLGSGNGGLDWTLVRKHIEAALSDLHDVDVVVYEPTPKYQNVAKRRGKERLTPARALIAEIVRRYWGLGFECSLLEIQKLAYFLERSISEHSPENPLTLHFNANRYGPYAERLRHLLDDLDGSYLHCQKRLGDADILDVIWFEESKREKLALYLKSGEAKAYQSALRATTDLIEGFQSPLGLELLSTVHWLLHEEGFQPNVESVKEGLRRWPAGAEAAARKLRFFDDRLIGLALDRLVAA